MTRIDRDQALLVIIDVQEKLMPVIHSREEVELNIERLARGCAALHVPIIVTEQYVKGLGATVSPLRAMLEETGAYDPIEKISFSACGGEAFLTTLAASPQRRQILIAGVETHVCVYQTVSDLLSAGFHVTVIADAVSSRSALNRDIALERMTSDGAHLSSTEMALFELARTSGTDEFKTIVKLVK